MLLTEKIPVIIISHAFICAFISVVYYDTRNNLLNDKQYIFLSSMSSADVLTTFIHKIRESIESKITVDMPKAFVKEA